MQSDFEKFNTKIIALSKDSVKIAGKHKARDKLSLQLLSDSDLKVIKLYGVEHHKAVEVSGPSINLLGIHIGMMPNIKTMAIPTSLLIDEEGIVRWVDQSDDYRLRSDSDLVLSALKTAFPEAET